MLPRNLIRQLFRQSLARLHRYPASPLFLYNAPQATLIIPRRHRRHMSAPQLDVSDISMERYHTISDITMEILLDSLEDLLDRLDNSLYEVEYHSGVLTLDLADKGAYVINKQPPNKQIWLSSPFSGPKRYDYSTEAGAWIYARDAHSIGDLLNEELSRALQIRVDVGLSKQAS